MLIFVVSIYLIDNVTGFGFHALAAEIQMDNMTTPFTAKPRLAFVVGFVSWRESWQCRGILEMPARH